MALPPRGDPQRPMFLAISWLQVHGVFSLFVGVIALAACILHSTDLSALIFFSMFLLTPGILYVICAVKLEERRFWAIVLGLIVASSQLMFYGLVAIGLIFVSFEFSNSWILAFILVPFLILILCAFAFLILNLSKSFNAIKQIPLRQRGFEPLLLRQPSSPPPEKI